MPIPVACSPPLATQLQQHPRRSLTSITTRAGLLPYLHALVLAVQPETSSLILQPSHSNLIGHRQPQQHLHFSCLDNYLSIAVPVSLSCTSTTCARRLLLLAAALKQSVQYPKFKILNVSNIPFDRGRKKCKRKKNMSFKSSSPTSTSGVTHSSLAFVLRPEKCKLQVTFARKKERAYAIPSA